MLQLATAALIVWRVWRGGIGVGVLLMAAGLALHGLLALRLVRAQVGGVGGHAEWVRATSVRRRLRESRGWLLGVGLIVLGFVLTLR